MEQKGDIEKETEDKKDLLYPAFQKYYSALSSLDRFSKEKSFFENISALDSFFSEYRNVTFVLQKSLAHTQYMAVYKKNRDDYLSSCEWFIDRRNEITKEHPIQLIKQIDITVYYPFGEMCTLTKSFTVENDKSIIGLLDDIKCFFNDIGHIEVFFSASFSFYDKTSNVNIYDKILEGIHAMSAFLHAMCQEVDNCSAATNELKKKIDEFQFAIIPRDLFLVNDYVYYPDKKEFERAERTSMMFGGKPFQGKLPIGIFNSISNSSENEDDYFTKFIFMNAIIWETDLMPTIVVLFDDDTCELILFNSDLKTTFYRKINEIAIRIAKENIISVWFMTTYTTVLANERSLNVSSKERLTLNGEDVLTFMEVTKELSERECCFEQTKIHERDYIREIIANSSYTLKMGSLTMRPIIEAFKMKKDDTDKDDQNREG